MKGLAKIYLVASLTLCCSVVQGVQKTKYYGTPSAGWNILDPGDFWWDLTLGDLKISYTLDVSSYTPTYGSTFWTEVGLYGTGTWGNTPQGCMSAGSQYAAQTDPSSQDMDDNFILMAPYRYSVQTYDATDPDTVTPQFGTNNNYGFWFDRDGVDSFQAAMWGMIDGDTYNTNGIYEVEITYHAISPTLGTMFATINGVPQGFYTTTPYSGREPDIYPAGKSIIAPDPLNNGDLGILRVYANTQSGAAIVRDLTVTGHVIPAPGAILLSGIGVGLVGWLKRRRTI